MSKGEEKIASILRKNKIEYQREKSFSDLKHGLFRFDFYLPSARVVVEFNGRQHYENIKHFFKERREWQKAQEHDRRKISYCLANNIPIYIVPFWEIDKINTMEELFNQKFLATTRWKNDDDYKKYTLANKK